MSRRGGDDEPFLFDPPLVREEDEEEPAVAPRGGAGDDRPPDGDDLPLFAPDPFADPLAGEPLPRAAVPAPARAAASRGAARGDEHDLGFPFGERPPPHRPASRPAAPPRPAARPLGPAGDPAGWEVVDVAAHDEEAEDERGGEPLAPPAAAAVAPAAAGLAPRLLAIAVDGAVLAAVAALAVVGAVLLDLRPGLAALPGLAVLLAVFSFAYSAVPLAFWGATPGMAAARLVARDRDGGPLTFGQTALRWLAGLLTLLLAGLPMLLALGFLGGRSPADRLSGSLTWQRPPPSG
ncbi:MAG TPA: RDD family protein [Thermoanaerobaculia bacterium]